MQRGEITCLRSHSWSGVELVPSPGCVGHEPRLQAACLSGLSCSFGETRGWINLLLSVVRQELFPVPEYRLLAGGQTAVLETRLGQEGGARGLQWQTQAVPLLTPPVLGGH